MQFFGGGVSHKCTCKATNHFLRDCDRLDNDINQTDKGNNDVEVEGRTEKYDTGEIVQDDDEDYGYCNPLDEDSDDDTAGFEGGEPESSVTRDKMGDAMDANDNDLGLGEL
jgi:hypothetical protein